MTTPIEGPTREMAGYDVVARFAEYWLFLPSDQLPLRDGMELVRELLADEPGKTELAMGVVDVDPYVRRGEHGFHFVVGHERGLPAINIGQVLRAQFEVPGTPEEAARRDVDLAQRRAADHLATLEAMPDEELAANFHDEYGGTFSRVRNPLTKALYFERFADRLSPEDIEERDRDVKIGSVWHKRGSEYYEWMLKFARNDPDARRRAEENAVWLWGFAMEGWDRWKDEDREFVQDRATSVFSEEKMSEATAAFGLPEIFVATYMPHENAPGHVPLDRTADYGNHRITIYADRDGEVPLSEKYQLPQPPQPGGYVIGPRNLASTIRHEYGHMVQELIEAAPAGRYFSRRRDTYGRGKPDNAAYFLRNALERARKAGKPDPLVVSEYAGTNYREAWAEGFAIVMDPTYDREDWRGVIGEDLLDHVTNILETAGVHV